MTITVIFGAGASYDSDRQRPARLDGPGVRLRRPPLAADLFARNEVTGPVFDSLPVLQGAATRLSGLEGVGVEDELGRLQDEAATDPIRARQLVAARLYLRWTLRQITEAWSTHCHGLTSYAWLHDVLHGIRGSTGADLCYLTFNYDRILEEAVERLHDVQLGSLDSYTGQVGGVELFKLHGSLDWTWPFPGLAIERDGFQRAMSEVLLDRAAEVKDARASIRVTSEEWFEVPGNRRRIAPLMPALAIPVRRKYGLVLPEEMVERMKARLEETTRLIVVGWRAQEEHVLGILRDHMRSNQATLIVDRDASAAAEREQTLRGAGVTVGHAVLSEHGFSEMRSDEVTSFVTMAV